MEYLLPLYFELYSDHKKIVFRKRKTAKKMRKKMSTRRNLPGARLRVVVNPARMKDPALVSAVEVPGAALNLEAELEGARIRGR